MRLSGSPRGPAAGPAAPPRPRPARPPRTPWCRDSSIALSTLGLKHLVFQYYRYKLFSFTIYPYLRRESCPNSWTYNCTKEGTKTKIPNTAHPLAFGFWPHASRTWGGPAYLHLAVPTMMRLGYSACMAGHYKGLFRRTALAPLLNKWQM